MRYLICGEFGHAKGRAHWHGIFFVEGKPVELPELRRRVDWRFWPHGFAFFGDVTRESIAYAAKYALKASDADDPQYAGGRRRAFYSKKPPLGDEYFDDLARRTAQAGLAVHDNQYRFPDIRDRRGKPRIYFMTGRTLELFCERYVSYWELFSDRPVPRTEFLERTHFDPIARRERYLDSSDLERNIAARERERSVLRERREAFEASRPGRLLDRRDVGTLLLEGRASIALAWSDGSIRLGGPDAGVSCDGRRAADFFRGAAEFGLSGSEAETVWRWVRGVSVRFDPEGARYREDFAASWSV